MDKTDKCETDRNKSVTKTESNTVEEDYFQKTS